MCCLDAGSTTADCTMASTQTHTPANLSLLLLPLLALNLALVCCTHVDQAPVNACAPVCLGPLVGLEVCTFSLLHGCNHGCTLVLLCTAQSTNRQPAQGTAAGNVVRVCATPCSSRRRIPQQQHLHSSLPFLSPVWLLLLLLLCSTTIPSTNPFSHLGHACEVSSRGLDVGHAVQAASTVH